ncbi:hypothetical protein KY348_05015 [Candidatus Woesearchaeota archaeon]|nr:hypothetical protein [Candidatus Woesearchaeota archaeon]
MAEKKYVFSPMKSIEELADGYLKTDARYQMMKRNGMTREMFVNFHIINNFINKNDPPLETDQRHMFTGQAFEQVIKACAQHYHKPPEKLKEAWDKCTGTDFYDREKRERIEKEWDRLGKDKEQK